LSFFLYFFIHVVFIPGTPLLALTGTADEETQNVICHNLALKDPTKPESSQFAVQCHQGSKKTNAISAGLDCGEDK
jgi:superfamily II DNA helicase RecQ